MLNYSDSNLVGKPAEISAELILEDGKSLHAGIEYVWKIINSVP